MKILSGKQLELIEQGFSILETTDVKPERPQNLQLAVYQYVLIKTVEKW